MGLMRVLTKSGSVVENPRRALLLIFSIALLSRIVVWLLIPLDWNWDSYHHWQISYLTLKIGLSKGRLWDLNGCEYYWGMVPHLVQAFLLWLLPTSTLLPYRVLNTLLGGLNASLVHLVASRYYDARVGFYSGLLFAVFPVAAIFDVLALQDTIALSFLLASIYLLRSNPFWSGIALMLAGQSRTELWLVSAIVVLGVALAERLSTETQPLIIGYVFGTGVFSFFLYTQTSNPVYPLYYSLYNIFGGWNPGNEGEPFLRLMWEWVAWKLSVWPRKPTGVLILTAAGAFLYAFVKVARRRWRNYPVPLYFFTTTAVLAPTFMTYVGANPRDFIIMLRMAVPITGIGLPLLLNSIEATKFNLRSFHIEKALMLAFISSSFILLPTYAAFQAETVAAFSSSDVTAGYYQGGVLVCDYPTMNYRFVCRWGIDATRLLGNHYSPSYYGISDPYDYAVWLGLNNVTLWTYTGSRSQPVWKALSQSYPKLLVFRDESYGTLIYAVNQSELERIIG